MCEQKYLLSSRFDACLIGSKWVIFDNLEETAIANIYDIGDPDVAKKIADIVTEYLNSEKKEGTTDV